MKTAKQIVIITAVGYALFAMFVIYCVLPAFNEMFANSEKPLPAFWGFLVQWRCGLMILPLLLPWWAIRYFHQKQKFPTWLKLLSGVALLLLLALILYPLFMPPTSCWEVVNL